VNFAKRSILIFGLLTSIANADAAVIEPCQNTKLYQTPNGKAIGTTLPSEWITTPTTRAGRDSKGWIEVFTGKPSAVRNGTGLRGPFFVRESDFKCGKWLGS